MTGMGVTAHIRASEDDIGESNRHIDRNRVLDLGDDDMRVRYVHPRCDVACRACKHTFVVCAVMLEQRVDRRRCHRRGTFPHSLCAEC